MSIQKNQNSSNLVQQQEKVKNFKISYIILLEILGFLFTTLLIYIIDENVTYKKTYTVISVVIMMIVPVLEYFVYILQLPDSSRREFNEILKFIAFATISLIWIIMYRASDGRIGFSDHFYWGRWDVVQLSSGFSYSSNHLNYAVLILFRIIYFIVISKETFQMLKKNNKKKYGINVPNVSTNSNISTNIASKISLLKKLKFWVCIGFITFNFFSLYLSFPLIRESVLYDSSEWDILKLWLFTLNTIFFIVVYWSDLKNLKIIHRIYVIGLCFGACMTLFTMSLISFLFLYHSETFLWIVFGLGIYVSLNVIILRNVFGLSYKSNQTKGNISHENHSISTKLLPSLFCSNCEAAIDETMILNLKDQDYVFCSACGEKINKFEILEKDPEQLIQDHETIKNFILQKKKTDNESSTTYIDSKSNI